MDYNIIIACGCFTIIIIIIIIYSKEKFINTYNGICVFDLDNTITCGIDRAAEAINICKNNNYKIAFSTARPTPWYSDIKIKDLGLTEADFKDDFYHGEEYKCSFTDNVCLANSISDTKLKQLYNISKKYNIKPNKIILFDDQHYNVEKAQKNGFSVIHANNPMCGLPSNIKEQLHELMGLKI